MTNHSKLSGEAAKFLGQREQRPGNHLDELFKLLRILTKGDNLHLGQIIVEALERSRTTGEPLAEALRGLSNEELLQRIQQYENENLASRLNQADALLKDLSQSKEGEV